MLSRRIARKVIKRIAIRRANKKYEQEERQKKVHFQSQKETGEASIQQYPFNGVQLQYSQSYVDSSDQLYFQPSLEPGYSQLTSSPDSMNEQDQNSSNFNEEQNQFSPQNDENYLLIYPNVL
jgi:hypothetical protein